MAYLIIGLFACLVGGWVWAEYKTKDLSTRLALGGAAMLMLGASHLATAQSSFYRDAHNSAAIRLLGKALDEGDVESARAAIHFYNAQTPRQSGHAIVGFLAERERDKDQ